MNVLDQILSEIQELKALILAMPLAGVNEPADIIDRATLCKRLNITEPTVIRWEKKGKIPVMRIGSSIRYNWQTVIKALEVVKKK